MASTPKQKVVIVGAGPVGSLAALYAASRGDDVELYELRGGTYICQFLFVSAVSETNLSIRSFKRMFDICFDVCRIRSSPLLFRALTFACLGRPPNYFCLSLHFV
jgi:glycine/D-amino acid oxidase-like deaminating enzyme